MPCALMRMRVRINKQYALVCLHLTNLNAQKNQLYDTQTLKILAKLQHRQCAFFSLT